MLDFTSLKKSINILDKIVSKVNDEIFMNSIDIIVQDGLKFGVIQNF